MCSVGVTVNDFSLGNVISNIFVTGPAKIGHVGTQNLTTFQTFMCQNVFITYAMTMQVLSLTKHLIGVIMQVTESRYSIPVLRYNS